MSFWALFLVVGLNWNWGITRGLQEFVRENTLIPKSRRILRKWSRFEKKKSDSESI